MSDNSIQVAIAQHRAYLCQTERAWISARHFGWGTHGTCLPWCLLVRL